MCHYLVYIFFCECQYRQLTKRCEKRGCKTPASYSKRAVSLVCSCPGHGGPTAPKSYEKLDLHLNYPVENLIQERAAL